MASKVRGRPEHIATPAYRRTVRQLISVGEHLETIAKAIGVSVPTLEKHYGEELHGGAAEMRKQAVAAMFKAMSNGNASAIRMALVFTGAMSAEKAMLGDGPKKQKPVKLPKRGVKAMRDVDAAEAATDEFAVPAPPKLVVNNG